jgi:hypothetical protein
MLNERILKNKEFFTFKSLRDSFKADIIKGLRPNVQTEPINKLNDLKVRDKIEIEKHREKNGNSQQKNSNYIISQPINSEPVDSNLFFTTQLLHNKPKQITRENNTNTYFTKDEFELMNNTKSNFPEKENIKYPPTISFEKLSKKTRKKKKKSVLKKSLSYDLNEEEDVNNRHGKTPSPISKDSPAKEIKNLNKVKEEDLYFNERKNLNTQLTPESKELLYGNSKNLTGAINNSLSPNSTSPSSSYSAVKLSKVNNSQINSKSLKSNKKNKNNNNSNNESNKFNSHNNESFVDLPNIKSQDYDNFNRNTKISNKQQQCLLETESISKAGFNFNHNNKNNLSETFNKQPSLPKNTELDKSEKNNEKGTQNSFPILYETTLTTSTELLKTEKEALVVPIKTPSAKKLSRKMKLINNLSENKASSMSDTFKKNEGSLNYTESNNNALKFLNCLEKNKSKYDFYFIILLFKLLKSVKLKN